MTDENKKIVGRHTLMAKEKILPPAGTNQGYTLTTYAEIFTSAKTDAEVKKVIEMLEELKFGKLGHFVAVSNFTEE